jgi:hypothetical protein
MGWTGQTLRDGETVRDILTAAYQGDPLACASCAWHESAHPRVSGTEYDAIYGPRDDRPAAHDFVPSVPRYRVLDYAQVALTEVYLAVETIDTGAVWAGVALVQRTRSGEVTYKEMSEEMGPNAVRCPVRILDRLTPTTSESATTWRASCRARIAERASRPTVGDGTRVRFAQPLTFSNGATRDTFEMVKGSRFRAVEIEEGRAWTSSTRYHVANWRELAYSLA